MDTSARGSSNQTRRFTFDYFGEQFKEAWLIIFAECRAVWSEWRAQRLSPRATLSSEYISSLEHPEKVNGISAWDSSSTNKRLKKCNECDQSNGTLSYGLGCVSRMLTITFHYGPSFVLDPRPGLLPSGRFIATYWAVVLIGLALGLFVIKLILEPTLMFFLPGLTKSIIHLLSLTSSTCEVLLILYGLGSLLVLVHNRRFVREFVLYHCNIISLPKSYQRRKAVELFLCHYIMAILSKPLTISHRVIYDLSRRDHLFHWTAGSLSFTIARAMAITLTPIGSLLVCTAGMVVPYISTFLIVCSASHLRNFLHKHLARFDRATNKLAGPCHRKQRENPRIVELLDERTRHVISEYSCETLTEDWPTLIVDGVDEEDDFEGNEKEYSQCHIGHKLQQCDTASQADEQQESPTVSRTRTENAHSRLIRFFRLCFSGRQASWSETPILTVAGEALDKDCIANQIVWTCRPSAREEAEAVKLRLASSFNISSPNAEAAHYSSAANSLLFLYKNLIKSMSELKGMISIYERKFGTFHLIQICIDSLIVAQWITTNLTESRLRNQARLERPPNASDNLQLANTSIELQPEAAGNSSRITPLAIEATFGVLSFIVSNTFFFMRCDCLPDCMVKMRSKLFKMNIDLARSAMRPQLQLQHHHQQSFNQSGHSPRRSTLAVGRESVCWSSWQELSEGRKRSMRSNSVGPIAAHECAELDQVWSLYDQVARLSELANFKLSAGTYYSKRCLLWIFGRTVSLTLLCIQIIDIYSYT